jgi:hypothetical protein
LVDRRLRPLVDEYERLEAAAAALDGVSATSLTVATAGTRGASARSEAAVFYSDRMNFADCTVWHPCTTSPTASSCCRPPRTKLVVNAPRGRADRSGRIDESAIDTCGGIVAA